VYSGLLCYHSCLYVVLYRPDISAFPTRRPTDRSTVKHSSRDPCIPFSSRRRTTVPFSSAESFEAVLQHYSKSMITVQSVQIQASAPRDAFTSTRYAIPIQELCSLYCSVQAIHFLFQTGHTVVTLSTAHTELQTSPPYRTTSRWIS
jgi:hypothetical protein